MLPPQCNLVVAYKGMDRIADVRRSLTASRDRGVPFRLAWQEALEGVAWSDSKISDAERHAILATKQTWRRCYELRPPTDAERAASMLSDAI
jgi:hypothetical protein